MEIKHFRHTEVSSNSLKSPSSWRAWRARQRLQGYSATVTKRLNDHAVPLLRLFAGGSAIVSWYNAFSDPDSGLFLVALTSDGGFLLWVMAVTGMAIIIDVLINDWTPDYITFGKQRFHISWKRAFRHRHLLFVMLAFCYAAQPFVAARGGYGISLEIFFYWNCFQNITIAFLDVKQRTRSPGWERLCS